jgi:fumarylacetoacetate (FAA) hydrolase
MQIATYLKDEHEQLALLVENWLYDMEALHPDLPNTMSMLLQYWDDYFPLLQGAPIMIREGKIDRRYAVPLADALIQAPVPHPSSCRDGYAFRQHVAAARRNRKVPMIPEFDQYPIFYFTNHNAIFGPGDIQCMPDHFEKLDFELECAIVIARQGRNIRASDADSYIGGFMIMNDLSARTLQMEEMLLNLGPAKGKDFATVIGPVLVTPDELEAYRVAAKTGHTGAAYNLSMTCKVNGKPVSLGNLSDMDWTFAEIIERASYGATLYPGDVIGSGTVGTGCFLELNGTGKLQDPGYTEQWLKEGDVVEMEITGLGKLVNTIVREAEEGEGEPFSLLALKKPAP